jgi:hypothetical protein
MLNTFMCNPTRRRASKAATDLAPLAPDMDPVYVGVGPQGAGGMIRTPFSATAPVSPVGNALWLRSGRSGSTARPTAIRLRPADGHAGTGSEGRGTAAARD